MALGKFPMKFSTRLKQFFCKHETMGKMAFTKGINKKEGYNFVLYQCGKCGLCVTKWEKEEEW
jgi:hypothetical protein